MPAKPLHVSPAYFKTYFSLEAILRESLQEMSRRWPAVAFVIVAGAAAAVLILLASPDVSEQVQNITVAATASAAAALSVTVLLGQKTRHDLLPFAFLSAGLLMWSAAEMLWAYLVLALGIEVPFPSVADAFYLAGYALAAVFVFSLYRVSRRALENKLVVIVAAITIEAFFLNFFLLQLVESIAGFAGPTLDEGLLLAVSVAYPLLDGILLVPAVVLITGYELGIMSKFSIMIFAAGIVLFAAADTGFSYFALTDFTALQDETAWNVLYSISYVCFAGALLSMLLEKKATARVLGIKAKAS